MHPSSTESSNPPLPFLFDPDYFDSTYKYINKPSPPAKIDGVTTHHYVDTFVDNIKDAIAVYGSVFVKGNLHHCLRGDASRWYTFELEDLSRKNSSTATIPLNSTNGRKGSINVSSLEWHKPFKMLLRGRILNSNLETLSVPTVKNNDNNFCNNSNK
jgi:hypothetical protein